MAKKWAGLRQDTSVSRLKSTVEYLAQDVAALHQRLKILNATLRVLKSDHTSLAESFESLLSQSREGK